MYDALGPSFKSAQAQREMDQEFGNANSIFVSLSSTSDLTLGDVCSIKTYLARYLNSNEDLEKIVSPWSVRKPVVESDKLWYRTYVEEPCRVDKNLLLKNDWKKFSLTPWKHFFQGKNPNQISFEVIFKDQTDENGKNKFDVKSIGRFINGLNSQLKENSPHIESHIFGQMSLRWYINEILKKDSVWNLGIMIFFLLFFYYFLGTWKAGIYYAISLIFTEIFIFGLMGLIGYPIDIMSNCLFLMTAIAGVSDFLFVTSAQKEGEGWEKSFLVVATPSFFTSLTTVIGFLSLGLSEIPAISRFGFAAGFGAIFQWSATYLILPAVLRVFKVRKEWIKQQGHQQVSAPWFLRLNRIYPRRWLTIVLVVTAFASALTLPKLNIGEDMLSNFPDSHPLPRAYSWLKEDKGWQGQVFLNFKPEVSEKEITPVIGAVAKLPNVVHLENPFILEDFLTQGLTGTKKEMVLRDLSPFALKGYRSHDHYTRVPFYTDTLDVKLLNSVVNDVETLCAGKCFLAGRTITYLESSEKISTSLIDSLLSSVLTVAVLIVGLAWLKGNKNYFTLVISSIWGPLIMLGFLWITQLPVSSVTSIFFALIVGWTGDNAIQYLFADEDILEGAEQRASATLMQTLVFCGSSLFLVFQVLIPMRLLGILFILGFFMTYIGDLWILKGLMHLTNRQKN